MIGTVHLFGEPLTRALLQAFRRIGSLVEQPSIYPHLTGTENIEIARRLKQMPRSSAEHVIGALGLSNYIDRKAREYSTGMRQRLGVAIARLGRPDLLILDEPMNGMDAAGLEAFRALLRRVNGEYGATILLSSHQLDEVDQVATHVGILSSMGDLLYQGTRHELSRRMPQRVVIKVRQREKAVKVLLAHGFSVDFRKEYLVVTESLSETASGVNRLLVANEIDVYHLEVELTRLHALFSEVLKTTKPWDSAV